MKIGGFEFSPGSRFQPGAQTDDAAAKLVGAHLELLREQCKGELTPRDVVDDARHDNSPLHSYFEWNDGAAAEAYRLQQARGLIRSVVAVYRDVGSTEPGTKIRAYVHVPEPSAPHYREMTHAMSLTKTRQLVLQKAWRELQAWRQRYKDLEEFADLITVIDEVDQRLPSTATA